MPHRHRVFTVVSAARPLEVLYAQDQVRQLFHESDPQPDGTRPSDVLDDEITMLREAHTGISADWAAARIAPLSPRCLRFSRSRRASRCSMVMAFSLRYYR